jgi:hypothetical protein
LRLEANDNLGAIVEGETYRFALPLRMAFRLYISSIATFPFVYLSDSRWKILRWAPGSIKLLPAEPGDLWFQLNELFPAAEYLIPVAFRAAWTSVFREASCELPPRFGYSSLVSRSTRLSRLSFAALLVKRHL